jgi:hypothetical protein
MIAIPRTPGALIALTVVALLASHAAAAPRFSD